MRERVLRTGDLIITEDGAKHHADKCFFSQNKPTMLSVDAICICHRELGFFRNSTLTPDFLKVLIGSETHFLFFDLAVSFLLRRSIGCVNRIRKMVISVSGFTRYLEAGGYCSSKHSVPKT